MKYFISTSGQLHAYEADGSQDSLIPADFVAATDAQVQAIQNHPKVEFIAPLTPRQIRQALTRAGLRSMVEGAVASGNQDLKDWWEFSSSFERKHPEVVGMGQALGQSDAQLDALWALGATL